MLTSLASRLIGWIDRVVDADERVVCAICDERFANLEHGKRHVCVAHPLYAPLGWQTSPTYAAPALPGYAFRIS